jgi:hypothetical protein
VKQDQQKDNRLHVHAKKTTTQFAPRVEENSQTSVKQSVQVYPPDPWFNVQKKPNLTEYQEEEASSHVDLAQRSTTQFALKVEENSPIDVKQNALVHLPEPWFNAQKKTVLNLTCLLLQEEEAKTACAWPSTTLFAPNLDENSPTHVKHNVTESPQKH